MEISPENRTQLKEMVLREKQRRKVTRPLLFLGALAAVIAGFLCITQQQGLACTSRTFYMNMGGTIIVVHLALCSLWYIVRRMMKPTARDRVIELLLREFTQDEKPTDSPSSRADNNGVQHTGAADGPSS